MRRLHRLTFLALFAVLTATMPLPVLAGQPEPVALSGADILMPAAKSAPLADPTTFEREVIYYTNLERIDAGLLPLHYNANLQAAAYGHSEDMAINNFFNHVGSGDSTLVNRVQGAGYTGWTMLAENIAAGYSGAQTVVTVWMNSPGHRANILRTTVNEIGVGYYFQASDQANVVLPDGSVSGPFFHYLTQDFGARSGVYPVVLAAEAMTTTQTSVTLHVYGQGWASEMMIANDDRTFTGAQWQPFQQAVNWTLPASEGLHTVYARLRDAAGLGPQAVVDSFDTIYLDLPNTATVGGMVFLDSDTDGVRDPGQNNGLSGIAIALRDSQGLVLDATLTNDNGNYSFTNLAAGAYSLEADLGQLASTSPNPHTVTLVADATTTVDFGYMTTTGLVITAFDALPRGHAIELIWQTLHSDGSEVFTIERAAGQAGPYAIIDLQVVADDGTAGNARFVALDDTTQTGQTYWYRLQAPDGQLVGPIQAQLPSHRLFLPLTTTAR